MIETWLPMANTALIVCSGVALVLGRIFIARGQIDAHRKAMLTACGFAVAFLVVYVTRWTLLGSHKFTGQGAVRTFYFALLIGHSILAVVIVPMAITTVRRGLAGNIDAHRRIARLTFPAWLTVVVSGWGVYWMLYHL